MRSALRPRPLTQPAVPTGIYRELWNPLHNFFLPSQKLLVLRRIKRVLSRPSKASPAAGGADSGPIPLLDPFYGALAHLRLYLELQSSRGHHIRPCCRPAGMNPTER